MDIKLVAYEQPSGKDGCTEKIRRANSESEAIGAVLYIVCPLFKLTGSQFEDLVYVCNFNKQRHEI